MIELTLECMQNYESKPENLQQKKKKKLYFCINDTKKKTKKKGKKLVTGKETIDSHFHIYIYIIFYLLQKILTNLK